MAYDNWKTTNPDDNELGSARQRAPCSKCGDDIYEDDGHIVECFETTGKILCVSCWDGVCEAEFRKGALMRHELPPGECVACDAYRGQMHPSHDASPNCESGKRDHCSCEACF